MNDSNNTDKTTRKLSRTAITTAFVVVLAAIIILYFAIPQINLQTLREDILLIYAGVWPVKFEDSFDSQSIQSWKPTDGLVETNINTMVTSSGQLNITFAPTQEFVVRDAFYNELASASGDFLLTMRINPPISCHTGLIFRGSTLGDYYLFMVGGGQFTAEILTHDQNGDLPREAIIPNTNIPGELEEPYTLNVLAYNDSYYFYINRSYVGKMSDERLEGERTGIELMVCQGVISESVFQVEEFRLQTP